MRKRMDARDRSDNGTVADTIGFSWLIIANIITDRVALDPAESSALNISHAPKLPAETFRSHRKRAACICMPS